MPIVNGHRKPPYIRRYQTKLYVRRMRQREEDRYLLYKLQEQECKGENQQIGRSFSSAHLASISLAVWSSVRGSPSGYPSLQACSDLLRTAFSED